MSQILVFLGKAVNNLGDKSPYLQIAVGAGGGFASGFVLLKAFKVLAIILGGGILIVELALQSGVLTIDWKRAIKQFGMDGGEGEERQTPFGPQRIPDFRAIPRDPFDQLRKSLVNSARFSVAFIGGFLLGMGFS